MVPHRTPFFLPLIYPASLTWRIPTYQRELYLTFDDGPVDGPTDFVLETLQYYAAKATFFCIGDNILKHEKVFLKAVDGEHRIGNHTFNHLNGWKTSRADYRANVDKCNQQIRGQGNYPTRLFRPPYGRITRSQIKDLADYKIIMWDVLSIDYNQNLAPEKCLRNTIRSTRPGSIIVFHDSFKAERNLMYALPRYLEHFVSRGFEFKVLS